MVDNPHQKNEFGIHPPGQARPRIAFAVWLPLALIFLFGLPLPSSMAAARAAKSGSGKNWRPFWQLSANRDRLHRWEGGPVLNLGSPEALMYLPPQRDNGWKGPTKGETTNVLLLAARSGVLSFSAMPEDVQGERALLLRAKIMLPGATLGVRLNRRDLGILPARAGWHTARWKIPTGVLHVGENDLEFRVSKAAPSGALALNWAWITTPARANEADPGPAVVEKPMGGRSAVKVWRTGDRLRTYLTVPHDARLRLVVGATADAQVSANVSSVQASIAPLQKQWHLGPGVRARNVKLDGWAGQLVALDVVVRPAPNSIAGLADMSVDWPAVAPAAKPMNSRNVVVWVMDALRADHVHAYHPSCPVKADTVDAFAKRATGFRWSMSAAAHSLPSHASILTSQNIGLHKAVQGEEKVATASPFLPEVAHAAGVRTALISANGYVSDKWGFKRGWDFYSNTLRDNKGTSCQTVLAEAARFLKTNATKPFLLYLVPIETHVTYRFRPEFTDLYDEGPKPYRGPFEKAVTGKALGRIRGGWRITPRDRQRLVGLYRGNVAQGDVCFGELQNLLDRNKARADTSIVFTSDHGDALFDDDDVGHAHTLYQQVAYVPMMIEVPGQTHGAFHNEGASHLDIAPTVLNLLKVPIPAAMQGRSLVDRLGAETNAAGDRMAVANHGAAIRALQLGHWKYIVAMDGKEELYDLEHDPGEETNLASSLPMALRSFRDLMGQWRFVELTWRANRFDAFNAPNPAFADWLESQWQLPRR